MVVTATEFKQNLGTYLELSNNEEIVITKNGRPQSFLIGSKQRKRDLVDELSGILADYKPTQEDLDADPRLAHIWSR